MYVSWLPSTFYHFISDVDLRTVPPTERKKKKKRAGVWQRQQSELVMFRHVTTPPLVRCQETRSRHGHGLCMWQTLRGTCRTDGRCREGGGRGASSRWTMSPWVVGVLIFITVEKRRRGRRRIALCGGYTFNDADAIIIQNKGSKSVSAKHPH